MGYLEALANILCKQDAVYWSAPIDNGEGGLTWTAGVEIKVRWEDVTEIISTKTGEEITSMAKVTVKQDVDERGMLFLGTIDDLDSGQDADPVDIPNAYEIKKFAKTPAFGATSDGSFWRVAYL